MENEIQEIYLEKSIIAVQNNNFSAIKSHIDYGFDIKYKGFNIFEAAALEDNVEMYQYLWSFLNFKDENDKKDIADYLFTECVCFEAVKVISFLANHLENLFHSQREPLKVAINTQNLAIIEYVLLLNPCIIDKSQKNFKSIILLDNIEIFNLTLEKLTENQEMSKLPDNVNEYIHSLAKKNIKTYLEQLEQHEKLDNLLGNKEYKNKKKKI